MSSPFIPVSMIPNLMRQIYGQKTSSTNPLSLTLPKPYAEWQQMLMSAKLRLAVFPCGTKAGKTLGGACRIAKFSFTAQKEQDALYRIIAPTYQLSSITYRYLSRLLPEKLPQQANMTREQQALAARIWEQFTPNRTHSNLRMEWKHNNARIACVHGQDPEVTIEGERVHGNIFDEASKMKKQVYASGLSTTSQTGGWNVLYSTPMGKNFFYELYRECLEHMEWAKKTGKPLEMFAATAPTVGSPYVDPKVIEQARKTLPDRIFRQLYLAEFVDDGSVFIGFRQCIFGNTIELQGKQQGWQVEDTSKKTVVIGADWAKRNDYTVFIAIDVESKPARVVGFRRFHGLQYKQSIKELALFTKQFAEVLLIRHDRTGVGDVIDELLEPIPVPIDPIVFTNISKSSMVDTYGVALQTQAIQLPNWKTLIDEHENYDVKTNQLGKPIYGAILGQHDDIVTACFLAWSAYIETQDVDYDVVDLDELMSKTASEKDTIESWYRELLDDEDEF